MDEGETVRFSDRADGSRRLVIEMRGDRREISENDRGIRLAEQQDFYDRRQ